MMQVKKNVSLSKNDRCCPYHATPAIANHSLIMQNNTCTAFDCILCTWTFLKIVLLSVVQLYFIELCYYLYSSLAFHYINLLVFARHIIKQICQIVPFSIGYARNVAALKFLEISVVFCILLLLNLSRCLYVVLQAIVQ